ncbi:hypothetical protein HETIRDRAFT_122465 [Heterobasidion irregulare TC 32-1]|uniref:HAD-like protein n=1 Tax=Heterobasidion irregulare (strain TC 32-1) TaxID=747525 RepID=W4KKY8_HETIT|nr:uncharacterized protein HETIRDRAFT_122465 [Heterobasidion irregulare TC 32-1]ETW85731.1 hypothetical protein HETIRDRAFT_122465 [Heterobasidion irregulare TC 32-1]
MASEFKAVIFDIGGVVLRSPLIAIAAYEREHGIPNNYINCSITYRGSEGAWQRFERGEMSLFPFYEAFGRELSDTGNGNKWYNEYCRRKGIECPELPRGLNIDGRDLFGRMMRESATFDGCVVEAIHRIRAAKRWRLIALTNNFSKTDASLIGHDVTVFEKTPGGTLESELKFLGWENGAVPSGLRELFDDFIDSSQVGMRKPEPEFYLFACRRNNIRPNDAIFLDDLGHNLRAAKQLGMETIREFITR